MKTLLFALLTLLVTSFIASAEAQATIRKPIFASTAGTTAGPIEVRINPEKIGVVEIEKLKPTSIPWRTSRPIVEGQEKIRFTSNRPNIMAAVNGDDQTFIQGVLEAGNDSIKLLPGWQIIGLNSGLAQVCIEVRGVRSLLSTDCVAVKVK